MNKSAVIREYVFPLLPTYNKRVGIFGENFHKKVVTRELQTFPRKAKVFLADKPI